MSKESTSFFGHLYAASGKALRVMAAPVIFVGRAAGQALERLIPHGASEVGQVLYGGGSAYAPPGVTERLTQAEGNVHGTAPAQEAASMEDYQRRVAARSSYQAPSAGRER